MEKELPTHFRLKIVIKRHFERLKQIYSIPKTRSLRKHIEEIENNIK